MFKLDKYLTKKFVYAKPIGRGSFGIVWKAYDKETRKIVAIKKICQAFRSSTMAQKTFREIMILRSINDHPSIIKLIGIHKASNDTDIYIQMEYLDLDLQSAIRGYHFIDEDKIKYVIYQVLNGLEYIHSKRIVHRDLKPNNILMNRFYRCKIADFGLARSMMEDTPSFGIFNHGDRSLLTNHIGTKWYRAPELLLMNSRYTNRIDMWSLGCIFGEMYMRKQVFYFDPLSFVDELGLILTVLPELSNAEINEIPNEGYRQLIINGTFISNVHLTDIMRSEEACDEAIDLFMRLLAFIPKNRISATEAINHNFFAEYRNTRIPTGVVSDTILPLTESIRFSKSIYKEKLYEAISENEIKKANSSSAIEKDGVSKIINFTKSEAKLKVPKVPIPKDPISKEEVIYIRRLNMKILGEAKIGH